MQYVWQHQLLEHRDGLLSTDGRPLRISRAGDLNTDAGPDFFNVRIVIDDVEWVGNVEVHVRASDWTAHRHQHDKAYNNVVLHVVYENDAEITLENGKSPVTLELKPYIAASLLERYDELMQHPDGIPCEDRLHEVPRFMVEGFMDRLVVERIEQKANVVNRLLAESRGNWEQTCYWLLARYIGGRVNALPFELLAKATDMRLLARWKDNPRRIEAILMGQAGLLEGSFNDDFPKQLQSDYEAIRSGAGLIPIEGHLWKFYCLRPGSFPTIRISQFAHLLSESSNLFSTLLEKTAAADIVALFNQHADEYWTSHYRFDKLSSNVQQKAIGRSQAEMLVINAWVPLLFVYGSSHGQQQFKEQALDLLAQLPSENNSVIRCWRKAGLSPDNAARSQALLQLSNNYCSNRRCLNCAIGFNVIKRK